jgi:hypothetical protein
VVDQLFQIAGRLFTERLPRKLRAFRGLRGIDAVEPHPELVWLGVITVTVSPSATRSTVPSSTRWGVLVAGAVPVDGTLGVGLATERDVTHPVRPSGRESCSHRPSSAMSITVALVRSGTRWTSSVPRGS